MSTQTTVSRRSQGLSRYCAPPSEPALRLTGPPPCRDVSPRLGHGSSHGLAPDLPGIPSRSGCACGLDARESRVASVMMVMVMMSLGAGLGAYRSEAAMDCKIELQSLCRVVFR